MGRSTTIVKATSTRHSNNNSNNNNINRSCASSKGPKNMGEPILSERVQICSDSEDEQVDSGIGQRKNNSRVRVNTCFRPPSSKFKTPAASRQGNANFADAVLVEESPTASSSSTSSQRKASQHQHHHPVKATTPTKSIYQSIFNHTLRDLQQRQENSPSGLKSSSNANMPVINNNTNSSASLGSSNHFSASSISNSMVNSVSGDLETTFISKKAGKRPVYKSLQRLPVNNEEPAPVILISEEGPSIKDKKRLPFNYLGNDESFDNNNNNNVLVVKEESDSPILHSYQSSNNNNKSIISDPRINNKFKRANFSNSSVNNNKSNSTLKSSVAFPSTFISSTRFKEAMISSSTSSTSSTASTSNPVKKAKVVVDLTVTPLTTARTPRSNNSIVEPLELPPSSSSSSNKSPEDVKIVDVSSNHLDESEEKEGEMVFDIDASEDSEEYYEHRDMYQNQYYLNEDNYNEDSSDSELRSSHYHHSSEHHESDDSSIDSPVNAAHHTNEMDDEAYARYLQMQEYEPYQRFLPVQSFTALAATSNSTTSHSPTNNNSLSAMQFMDSMRRTFINARDSSSSSSGVSRTHNHNNNNHAAAASASRNRAAAAAAIREDDIDFSYEGLWDLAEQLGEVKNRGAPSYVIKNLPTHRYHHVANSAHSDRHCAICLTEYERNEELKVLVCTHSFHSGCLDKWLQVNASCPVCREKVWTP